MRKFLAELVVFMALLNLSSCSMVELYPQRTVTLPALPPWIQDLSGPELHWHLESPALENGQRVLDAAGNPAIQVETQRMPPEGTWLLAELRGPGGPVYARLGVVWGQVLGLSQDGPQEADSAGGLAAAMMQGLGVSSTSALRFNHLRLYREVVKRLGQDSWMINPSSLESLIATDRFRSDTIKLPRVPEELLFVPGTSVDSLESLDLRSLDHIFARDGFASEFFARGGRVGTWRFANIVRKELLTVTIREDGRCSLWRVPCGSGLPGAY